MATKTKKSAKAKKGKVIRTGGKLKTPVPTVLSFILDESGSMASFKDATISGFNEYLNTMKKDKGEISFTLTQFTTDAIRTVISGKPIAGVPELNGETYRPSFGTPLYDAIGQTIATLEKELIGKEKKVKNGDLVVLVTIMTDGQENESKEYNNQKIKDLIASKTKEGWVFTYLGANQDAWAVGSSIGVGIGNSMTYDQSQTKGTFSAHATGVSNLRSATKQARVLISADFSSADNLGLKDDEYLKLTGGKDRPTTPTK